MSEQKLKISLAAARVNAKLTQADIARIMHINKATVGNWENGKIIPKPAQLAMYCDICNIPRDCIKL